jgi:CHAD domain
MMTTDRTAIRRRLAVPRKADRPPGRTRKLGHERILAPLAASIVATLAATVVVGLGVALIKDERQRRSESARRIRDRQFGLWPDERSADGLRRMALAQLELAIELLNTDGREMPAGRAVHETRKALKRLRALMRTLRWELGETAFAREDALLRDAGRRLASARDAEVMVATLDGLLQRNHAQLAHLDAVRTLRAQFAAERRRAHERALADARARAEISSQLLAVHERVLKWRLTDRGLEAWEPGLQQLYRQGRRRWRRAKRRKQDARAMHLWRKRVKDLRYAAEMLERRAPDDRAGAGSLTRSERQPAGRARRAQAARRINRLASRADELGELLGVEHDLAVLAERVRAAGEPFAGEAQARKLLLQLIARRRRRLRNRALRKGERLYRRRPKRFIGRMREDYRRQK